MKDPLRAAAVLTVAALSAFSCGFAHAQFRASLTGTVTDPSGAVVPGAKVSLTDVSTGHTWEATSNDSGVYNFNALPPDTFKLTVSMAGFQGKTIPDLHIIPEQPNNVDMQLALGNTSTSVEVNAVTIPTLETSTASISGTLSSNDIQHLPSAGRDVFSLTQLAPGSFGDGGRGSGGATNNLPGTQGPGGSSAGGGMLSTENGPQAVANGGQYETNSINVDGISTVSAVWGGTTVITPNEDSIDNVKITSNGYDAEFGRFSGANVQVTTKAGTNQFHGSAFWRAARPGLNAFQRYNGPGSLVNSLPAPGKPNNPVTRAAARGLIRDTTRLNDIGGSVGGPILKDRLFFFFALEDIRDYTNTPKNGWYETTAFDAAAPTGNISNVYNTFPRHAPVNATLITSTCAAAGFTEGVGCATIPGQGIDIGSPLKTARGTLDPSYVSPSNPGVGAGLDGVADLAQYQTNAPDNQIVTQYNGRLDADVTKKDHLAFAIYWQPLSHQSINGATRGYNQWNHHQINDAFTLIWNHTFTPTFLNEARANASGWRWNEVTDNPQAPFGLPTDNIDTLQSITMQPFGASGPSHLNQWTYGYKDVATKVIRTHTIKFGGEATNLHYLQDSVAAARPSFNFYNIWDYLNDAPRAESGTFNRFTGVPFDARFDERQWVYGGFVQDDWKVTKNLTVNVGLRYNYFDSLYSKQGNMPREVFGQGSALFTGLTNVRGGKLWTPNKGDFGPQIGFAFNPDFWNHRFVMRGGYGINYNQEEIAISANTSFNPGDTVNVSFGNSTPTSADPHIQYAIASDAHSIFGYAPNPNAITNYGANGLPTGSGFRLTTYPNHLHTQQVHHYSLDTQFDLGHQMVASIGYEGSSAHHLIFHTDAYLWGQFNGIPYNPAINYIEYFGDTGASSYNAMIVDLKHNMSHQFSADASFTWSKSMDDGSGPYEIDPYSYNPVYARGRSDFNVGKAFKLYGIYSPKIYSGSNHFAETLLNGFNISGIYNLHTGFPWTPQVGYGQDLYYLGSGIGTIRPTGYNGRAGHDHSNKAFEAASGPSSNFPGGAAAFFSQYPATIKATSKAFPAPVTFFPVPGIARNSFEGPRYSSLDATITKSFGIPNHYLGERTGVEFRVDAFNLFNQTNLGQGTSINSDIGNSAFGISTTGLAGRQIQMQARISF